ncbi:MAG: hypothetical protein ACOCZU_07205 [Planctomycetota bacterium]
MPSPHPARVCVVFALLLLPSVVRAEGAVRDIRPIGGVLHAAGERGLLLRSNDDGKTWTPLRSPTDAHWESFAGDANALVLIGGQASPGNPLGSGQAAMYRREAGDANFAPLPARPPGWLRGGLVRGKLAAVYGEATPETPAGMARTVTGGRRWTPVKSDNHGPLLGGTFRTWREGYLLGTRHRIVALSDLKEPADRPADVQADVSLRCGAFVTSDAFWAAGDNGLLLRRQPAGRPWSVIPARLPAGSRRLTDFTAIATDGEGRVWLGGGQAGFLLHTPDAGRTWRTVAAPTGGAIHALHHVGDDTLLAGGTGGRIWRSTDGGKTWSRRAGADRPDVLFIASATDIGIWPAVVTHAQAGVECVVAFATTPPPNGRVAPSQSLRAAGAVAGASGSVVLTEFPSQVLAGHARAGEADMLNAWNLQLDANAADVMTRQLAAVIRQMRPRVLVTGPDTTHRLGGAGEARLVARLAHRAIERAADPNDKSLAAADLQPYRPARVFAGGENNDTWTAPWDDRSEMADSKATTALSLAHFPAAAETSIEMLAQRAIWTLPHTGPFDRPARLQRYHARHERLTSQPRPLFTTGLTGGRLRLDTTVSKGRRSLAAMAYLRMSKAMGGTGGALTHLARIAQEEDDDALAADRLMLAWWRLMQVGDLARAREARDLFLRHGRGHPMLARGLALTLALEGSAEWATLPREAHAPDGASKPLRVDRAAEMLAGMPGWGDDPGVRLIMASALAARNQGPAARKWIESVKDGAFDPRWTSYAADLLGASVDDVRVRPRRVVEAHAMAKAGTLDGQLDEAFWKSTKPLTLKPAGDTKTSLSGLVRLLRSPTHLLVGVQLPRDERRSWTVDLAMDTDRDAATQIVVTFDSDGKKTATFRSRLAPPVSLPAKPILLQGRKTARAFTFELAVPLKLIGQAPQAEGKWNLQVRATAWEKGRTTALYLEPLARELRAIHRYASLKLPAPKTRQTQPSR